MLVKVRIGRILWEFPQMMALRQIILFLKNILILLARRMARRKRRQMNVRPFLNVLRMVKRRGRKNLHVITSLEISRKLVLLLSRHTICNRRPRTNCLILPILAYSSQLNIRRKDITKSMELLLLPLVTIRTI